ncbi:MAG: outer membrane lipoprotein carrier protein [bacterium]|jgi:outer membrane lipoprotein carrier protein
MTLSRPLFLLVLILVLFLLPQNLIANEKLIQKVQKRQESLKGFSATFQQIVYDKIKDQNTKASGTFYFRNPGLMKWDYKKPEEQLIVVGKKKVWIFDPLLENVTIQRLSRVTGMTSLSFLLGKGKLRTDFTVNQSPKKDLLDSKYKKLFLFPKKKDRTFAELQLGIDPNNFQIKQIAIIDRQKNYRKITLTKLQFAKILEEKDFIFKVTSDMEVIE